MKIQINSIFTKITEKVNTCTNCNFSDTQSEIISFINSSQIKQTDKTILINNIKSFTTTYQLQKYIYNALLKYEGLGIS